MIVPDLVEPIEGWRAWLVVRDHDELRLSSVIYPTLWVPCREEIAVCRPVRPERGLASARRGELHVSPDARCGCGIYAAKTIHHAAAYMEGYVPHDEEPVCRVIGRVALWGHVIEGERGYRASRAYPTHLYLPPASYMRAARITPAEAIEKLSAYRVPVELLGDTSKLAAGEALAA